MTKSYEPYRDLITAVSNRWNSTTISAFSYTKDPLGRRTARDGFNATGLAITNLFGYPSGDGSATMFVVR